MSTLDPAAPLAAQPTSLAGPPATSLAAQPVTAEVPTISVAPAAHQPRTVRLEDNRTSVLRRVLSFLGLIFMAVFLGAAIAGAIAGTGLLITLAVQHRL
jgi:hypothetical protein